MSNNYIQSISDEECKQIYQLVKDITGTRFNESQVTAIKQIALRLFISLKKQLKNEDRIDEFKDLKDKREFLAKMLLNAVSNDKAYFRWTDGGDGLWKELTAYCLLINTFDNAEFKFETIVSYNDIIKGKV